MNQYLANLPLKRTVNILLALTFLGLAAALLWHDRQEMRQAATVMHSGSVFLVSIGLTVTLLYVLLHGWMYQFAFRVTGASIPLLMATRLFLRRNLASVFLPGGGVTSLALFSGEIGERGINRTKVHIASGIYGAAGIASLVAVALPVLAFETWRHTGSQHPWPALLTLLLLMVVLAWLVWSVYTQGTAYRFLLRIWPAAEKSLAGLLREHLSWKYVRQVLLFSVLIEVAGMVHLLLAMAALGLPIAVETAITGYTIATLFLCISPFLRGLGAVELSLTFILTGSGFSAAEAVAITLLYRVFEFWAPLAAGAFSFIFRKGNILLRVFPALLLFLLGIVNIISVLTPAVALRVRILHEFLPVASIRASNYLVLIIGGMLLVVAAFLLRGLKNAWYLALALSVLSFIGHLTKAIDYEEALLALLVMVTLWTTRNNYFVKGDRAVQSIGIGMAVWVLFAVLVFGVTGFYFLDQKHFGIDFSLRQALFNTLDNFLLLNTSGLQPQTHFAKVFLVIINILGGAALSFLFYCFIKPFVFRETKIPRQYDHATELLVRYGRSPVDYFKLYPDKLLFFGTMEEGFIAYKRSRGFALVLAEPVCRNDQQARSTLLLEFETFCKANGWRPSYYRIDEPGLALYSQLGKKAVCIGQEALIDLETFSLEGKERKSLRNAVNSVKKKGYVTRIYEAPTDGLIRQLKLVSDEWLKTMNRKELVFSQGRFDNTELKRQTILTLENEEEKVVAFLNMIPDYVAGEATYDMIRKTGDAPGGNMDVLILELIRYCQEKGYRTLNMGLAPLSGIEMARDLPERTIKFAYEKVQQFRHYRGLRDFKEKFDPSWENKYLVYDHHFDLIQLPMALSKVMRSNTHPISK